MNVTNAIKIFKRLYFTRFTTNIMFKTTLEITVVFMIRVAFGHFKNVAVFS